MKQLSFLAGSLALAVIPILGMQAAQAQSGAEFFNGKVVNYVVATDPGGGYDTNGRLVAEYMEKHLPGSTFVVRNMPGAGHMIGANYIYAAEPDGLTIGTFNTGLIYSQLVADPGVRFDLSDMSWIGKVASDPRVIMVSSESGIESFDELRNLESPIRFAAGGVGSASTVEASMLIDALNLPIELITGYNGNDGLLAMRRGEVQGILGARSSFQQFVDEGFGVFVAQIGGSGMQTDVPQLHTLVDDEIALRVVALVASQGDISRLTAGPAGIPEDRLQALQDAYAAATSDPAFLEKAAGLGLPVEPLVGDQVHEAVAAALDQAPEIVTFLADTLEE